MCQAPAGSEWWASQYREGRRLSGRQAVDAASLVVNAVVTTGSRWPPAESAQPVARNRLRGTLRARAVIVLSCALSMASSVTS